MRNNNKKTKLLIHTDIQLLILHLIGICFHLNISLLNLDKFLKCMGNEKSVFMFFFVGIDETGIVNTVLASVFHDKLQNTTLLQHHWAGRGTRGTAQFNGKTINELLYDEQFENNINDNESKSFLQKLLNR